MSQSFAEQLVAARTAAGLTQAQLAEALHMSRQGISHWETGRALPDAETLRQLSQVLQFDFITGQPMAAEDDAPEAKQVRPMRRRARLLASCLALAAVLAALLLWLLPGRGTGLQSPAPAQQAVVRIIPAQNPITPSIDPVLGAEPWWIYRLTIQETAGVNYTIEKMTTTYRYTDGRTSVFEQGAETIAANSNTGSNVLSRGLNIRWNGAQPLYDYADITVRLDGVDANGNELSFECVIGCVRPEGLTDAPDAAE